MHACLYKARPAAGRVWWLSQVANVHVQVYVIGLDSPEGALLHDRKGRLCQFIERLKSHRFLGQNHA
eukprot:1158759-Pelagomonas_calceolata.AAC.6